MIKNDKNTKNVENAKIVKNDMLDDTKERKTRLNYIHTNIHIKQTLQMNI